MKKGYVVAAMIIVIALAFTLWSFSSAMTPYVDIATARRIGGTVQVRGTILHDTVRYDRAAGVLLFKLQDKNHALIEVAYHGAKPDSFDTAPETAVTGYIRREPSGHEVFDSDSMAIKCPSKYSDARTPYTR